MKVHPTTVITGEVDIAEGVEIGPYCLIQGKVKIGKGTFVEGHVTLGSRYGIMEIGENNHFCPGAVIGGAPQDVTYKGEPTRLKIGSNNVFREFSTANLATSKADGETTIGDNNYLMAYTHIGHDCKLGNNIVIANDSHLGGHTVIEDGVTIGGVCAFNQFTKVGKFAFVAGGSVVNKDILPFTRAHGDHAVCRATNKVGLSRKGFSKEEVENVHRAIRIILMGSDTVEEGLERIQKECTWTPNIEYFVNFIKTSKRGIAK
ncbi:MAG: acyl-[acyl-carrier-protein]--UDP-N-acetylglucosamine O-acyltransferase [Oligoflexia bacterium]|nr:MAG: acyl-[acyl-carrier-protein]--UDP-N-acetylglucosamine O-acyltransferase [Oligoflexia bacterium]